MDLENAGGYFVLKLVVQNIRESRLAFVDIRKAFDTVDTIKLINIIKNDCVSNQLITEISIFIQVARTSRENGD
jgi:hypothetical protein